MISEEHLSKLFNLAKVRMEWNYNLNGKDDNGSIRFQFFYFRLFWFVRRGQSRRPVPLAPALRLRYGLRWYYLAFYRECFSMITISY